MTFSREFSPRFRSGCVTTDMPLLVDESVDLGVSEFCQKCQVCLRACPSGAIPESRGWVRGVNKYTIDGRKCRLSFNQLGGCAICIKVCVFSKLSHQGTWLKTHEVKA